jgi:hypothetical protein
VSDASVNVYNIYINAGVVLVKKRAQKSFGDNGDVRSRVGFRGAAMAQAILAA